MIISYRHGNKFCSVCGLNHSLQTLWIWYVVQFYRYNIFIGDCFQLLYCVCACCSSLWQNGSAHNMLWRKVTLTWAIRRGLKRNTSMILKVVCLVSSIFHHLAAAVLLWPCNSINTVEQSIIDCKSVKGKAKLQNQLWNWVEFEFWQSFHRKYMWYLTKGTASGFKT